MAVSLPDSYVSPIYWGPDSHDGFVTVSDDMIVQLGHKAKPAIFIFTKVKSPDNNTYVLKYRGSAGYVKCRDSNVVVNYGNALPWIVKLEPGHENAYTIRNANDIWYVTRGGELFLECVPDNIYHSYEMLWSIYPQSD